MQFKNHKITEALCAFRFEPSPDDLGIPLFGEYLKKIKPDGFTIQKEIKPLKVSFQVGPSESIPSPKVEEQGLTMVFTNPEKNFSILMKQNYISFHATNNKYPGWDKFLPEYVKVYMEKYFELDTSKNIKSAQMLYLNNFEINSDENLSDYLTCVPNVQDFGDGFEVSHLSHSNYKIKPNLEVILKTILKEDPGKYIKKVILECGCVALRNDELNDWVKLIKSAHDKAKAVFFKVTNDKLKEAIK